MSQLVAEQVARDAPEILTAKETEDHEHSRSISSDSALLRTRSLSAATKSVYVNTLKRVLCQTEAGLGSGDGDSTAAVGPVGIEFSHEELSQSAAALQHNGDIVSIKTRRYHLRWYPNCFVGRDLVDSLVDRHRFCTDRRAVVQFMDYLMRAGLVHHVVDDHKFKDDYLFYRFYSTDLKQASSVRSASTAVREFLTRSLSRDRSPSKSAMAPAPRGRLEEVAIGDTVAIQEEEEEEEEEEGEPLPPDMAKLAGVVRRNLDIRDRSYRLKIYHSVFVGSDLVSLLLELGAAENREYATQLGRALWTAGYFHHVHDDHQFNDRGFFYRFYCDEDVFVQRDTIQWLKHRAPKMPQLRWTALPSLVPGDSCEPTVWRIQPHTALNSIVLDPTNAGASFDGAEGQAFQETLRQRVCHLLGDPARRRGSAQESESSTAAVTLPIQGRGRRTSWTVSSGESLPEEMGVHHSYLAWEAVDRSRKGSLGKKRTSESLNSIVQLTKGDKTPVVLKRTADLDADKMGSFLQSMLDDGSVGERNDWLLESEHVLGSLQLAGMSADNNVVTDPVDLTQLVWSGEQQILRRRERPATVLLPPCHSDVLRDVFRITSGEIAAAAGLPVGTCVVYEVSVEHPAPVGEVVGYSVCSITGLPRPMSLGKGKVAHKEVLLNAYAIEPSQTSAATGAPTCRTTMVNQVNYDKRVPAWILHDVVRHHPLFGTLLDDVHTAQSVYQKCKEKTGVTLNDFDIMAVLGRGGYGKVLQVKLAVGNGTSHTVYAMKALKRDRYQDDEESRERVLLEREILTECGAHPFIVGLEYAFHTTTKLYMVMEFIAGGDLFTHIHAAPKTGFSTRRLIQNVCEIVLAVDHLHKNRIIYRDLKPENILCDKEGHMKLVDFGLSYRGEAGRPLRATSFCGTEKYMSPEQLLNRPYEESIDWWALGLVIAEMTSGGKHPFKGKTRMDTCRNMVQQPPTYRRSMLQPIDKTVIELMNLFLTKVPFDRLGYGMDGLEKIQKMRAFADVDWSIVMNKGYTLDFVPSVSGDDDLKYFDDSFTSEAPVDSYVPATSAETKPSAINWFANLFTKRRPSATTMGGGDESTDDGVFDKFDYQKPAPLGGSEGTTISPTQKGAD